MFSANKRRRATKAMFANSPTVSRLNNRSVLARENVRIVYREYPSVRCMSTVQDTRLMGVWLMGGNGGVRVRAAFTRPKGTRRMTGIQFVTDEMGRKVAVQIDLKKHGARLEDFWDGLISESRRKEKGIPLEKIKADLVKRGRMRE